MKRALAVASLLLAGCLDFTYAKSACFDAGGCKLPMGDPPEVVTTTPQNGKLGVGVNDAIVVTFSQEMDPATVDVELTPPDGLNAALWNDGNDEAVFTPAAPLRYSTLYTARVTGQAASDHASLMATLFTFTTIAPPDMVRPTLTSSLPANGAQNVGLTATLQLDFSEAMDQTSLSVSSNPPHDFGPPTWMGNGQTVRFMNRPMPYDPQTDYQLAIDGRDLAKNPLSGSGTLLFTTTAPPDTTPPVVLSMSPPAGSMMVSPSVNTNIALSFSEPMKPAVAQAVSIAPPLAGGLACSLDPGATLLTCTHAGAALATSTQYTVTLRADAGTEDLAGNRVAMNFTGGFTTGAVPDTTPPTILGVKPDGGALGQLRYPEMMVTFSEAMDRVATQGAIAVSSPQGVTGTYTWNNPGTQVTFRPTAPQGGFAYNTDFTWQVSTAAKDLAGNPLAMTQQFSFRVRRQATVVMTSLPADGYLRKSGAGTYSAVPTGTFTYVGDNASADDYRSLFYFDFNGNPGLPANTLAISAATFSVDIYLKVGDPRAALGGNPRVDSVTWVSPFTSASWSAAALQPTCSGLCFSGVLFGDDVGRVDAYVASHVAQALPSRRLLLRVGYPNETSSTAASDYIAIRTAEWATAAQRPTLQVTYEAP